MKRAGWLLVVLVDLRALFGVPTDTMHVRVRESAGAGWNFVFTCQPEAPCTFPGGKGVVFGVGGDVRSPVVIEEGK